LTIEQILEWADTHHEETGEWPNPTSGIVSGAEDESWSAINTALSIGNRGLPRGLSLPKILSEYRGVKNRKDAPLTKQQLLEWADAHHEATGTWPRVKSGAVIGVERETWSAIDNALVFGLRRLESGSSLAKLLETERGVPNRMARPKLDYETILKWADAHHQKTGDWPTRNCGKVIQTTGESWAAIDAALYSGSRGLPGGSSINSLLQKHRGVRHEKKLPPLTVKKILQWVDEHKELTGQWPNYKSGDIPNSGGETWNAVDSALNRGKRSLKGVTVHRVSAWTVVQ